MSEPALTDVEAAIVAALEENPDGMSLEELATYTGYEQASVSPRLRPMERRGLLVEHGRRHVSGTDRTVIVWGPK